MDLYLGLDGGQSHSLAILADGQGHILGAGLAGPSNRLNDPRGYEGFEQAIAHAVAAAFDSAGLPEQSLKVACFALSGGWQDRARKTEILTRCTDAALCLLRHDTESALAGATMGQAGVIVIAGTGSVAYGEDGHGRELLVGGWGYLMGDEGSAYWIALQALSAATKCSDGRGPKTSLLHDLPRAVGCGDLRALQSLLYSASLARPEVANLAVAVSQAAVEGDHVAQAILAEAGHELACHAVTVISRLDLRYQAIPVAPVGGVFQAGEWVQRPFRDHLGDTTPRARVIKPAFPSVIGALLLVYREVNVPASESVLNNLRDTQPTIDHPVEYL